MPDSLAARLDLPAPALPPLVFLLRRGWWWILLVPLLSLAATLSALHLVTPQFTASMVVAPTGRLGTGAMGMRMPATATAARGIAESGGGEEQMSDFSRYLALLTAVPVAERLRAKPGLMQQLFPTAWDQVAGEWRPPSGVAAVAARLARRLAGYPAWAPPDAVELSRLLKRELVIDRVDDGPVRRITFRHQDRAFALALLRDLHAAVEAHLRAEAERRIRAEMRFVHGKMSVSGSLDTQRALSSLAAEQERALLMLEVELPYAADMLEAPWAMSLADWPNPVLLLPASVALALAATLFGLFTLFSWRQGALS